MKSTGIGMFSALILILFFSCAPKEAPMPEVLSSSETISGMRVHKITYGDDPDAEKWFKYNNQGEIEAYNSFLDTVFFTYTRDSIRKVYSQSDHQWQTSVTYYLDSLGRAVNSILRGEHDEVLSTYKFIYDDHGYLIQTNQNVLTSGTSYKQTFTYRDGDVSEVIQYDFEDKPYAKYVYAYDVNKMAPAEIYQHSILEDFLSLGRLGKQNTHLPKSLVNVTLEGDTLAYLKFSYPEPINQDVLLQVEEDVLNENRMERKYHLEKFDITLDKKRY